MRLIDEGLISLAEAASLLPRRRGNKPGCKTVWRWARHGYRGIKLEYVCTPAGFTTSKQAVERFIAAVTAQDDAERRQLEELGDRLVRR